MHICFIEDTHLHGGTQIWVAEAVRAFVARGEQVTILAPTDSWVAEQGAQAKARIFTYDWDEVINGDEQSKEIWTTALDPCDVAICTVHPPRHGFHCSVFAAVCIKEGELKTHLIPKTGTIVPDYKREFYLPDETINSSVIAIADFTRQYLINTYKIPEKKTKLIYQGTDVRRFQSTAQNRVKALEHYPLPENAAPTLASVGSFEERKGHPILFEALSELASGPFPHNHLMMVGDGPDEEMLKEKVKMMGLEKNVSFFPFTGHPNLVFERIDITVMPSLYKEGLPNVLLESMSMHVPVISSNIGGVPEIVTNGETGYMVEPGDSGELARAIQKLWGDQEQYQKMRANTRKLIEEKFDKEIQFERFLDYFKEV